MARRRNGIIMRILYVDLDREWRGGQSQALLTVKGLRALGHDAQLLSVRESPLARRAAAAGIPVHDVGEKARRISAALLLRKMLSRKNYDVLHTNEPHALTAPCLPAPPGSPPVVAPPKLP